MSAWMYILKLKSDKLYVGITENLERRWQEHLSGCGARTTKYDTPECMLYSEEFANLQDAKKREQQIKKWTRAKKEALIANDKALLKILSKSKKK